MNGEPPGLEEEALGWEGMPSAEEQAWADAWCERNKGPLKKLIAEAEADFAAGRVVDSEEVYAKIRRKLALKSGR
jgi:hypothetical protein